MQLSKILLKIFFNIQKCNKGVVYITCNAKFRPFHLFPYRWKKYNDIYLNYLKECYILFNQP